MTALDHSAPEAQLAALIDAVRATPERRDELVALLVDAAPLHDGRTAAEVTRLRGYALAAFADTGLPAAAVPYVVEALESGDMRYEIAGAAIGARGIDPGVAASLVPSLLRAVEGLRGADAAVSFERYDPRWPYDQPTTALTEVLRTLAALGPAAALPASDLNRLLDGGAGLPSAVAAELRSTIEAIRASAAPSHAESCCHAQPGTAGGPIDSPEAAGDDLVVVVEDQDGRLETFAEFFTGRPSVVAFFYTRCDNPVKCSLTVATLGRLQALLVERGLAGAVRLAAVTYDPEFDLPDRLRRYGADRGVVFGPDVRAFRAIRGFGALRRRFELGVGYGPSTVNRHRIEVYVLDAWGDPVHAFTRVRWEPSAVLAKLETLLGDRVPSR